MKPNKQQQKMLNKLEEIGELEDVIVRGDNRGSGEYLHVTAKAATDDEVAVAQSELEASLQNSQQGHDRDHQIFGR